MCQSKGTGLWNWKWTGSDHPRGFSEVQATDVSAHRANAIPETNVHYSVQPAEATNFPDAYFDAVIVAQALHWFDLDQFWVEVNRGARVVFCRLGLYFSAFLQKLMLW